MRILITGGFGFVGGRLAVHFAHAGHNVVLGTRKEVSAPTWLPQAKVVQTVWDDSAALESICVNVDVVIHTAGMNSQECAANPVDAFEFNGAVTARLVAAANRASVRRFIYFSTAHVYSNPLVGSITEETIPRNQHPYATSNIAGEQALLSLSQSEKLEGIVLRLSNAFGAPTDKNVNCWMLLVNDLCKQAVQTRKLILQTSGVQYRNFISLNEVCRVTDYIAGECNGSLCTGIFNVGSSKSLTVLQMALLIQQRCLHVLGYKPILKVAEIRAAEKAKILNYHLNKLNNAGFTTISMDHVEIDKLLIYCHSVFDQSECFSK